MWPASSAKLPSPPRVPRPVSEQGATRSHLRVCPRPLKCRELTTPWLLPHPGQPVPTRLAAGFWPTLALPRPCIHLAFHSSSRGDGTRSAPRADLLRSHLVLQADLLRQMPIFCLENRRQTRSTHRLASRSPSDARSTYIHLLRYPHATSL
jgi:hypothetical protein